MWSEAMCSGRAISRMPVKPISSVVVTVEARSLGVRARWTSPPTTEARNGSPVVPSGGSAGSRLIAMMLSVAAHTITMTAASTETTAATVAAVAGPAMVAELKLTDSNAFARASRSGRNRLGRLPGEPPADRGGGGPRHGRQRRSRPVWAVSHDEKQPDHHDRQRRLIDGEGSAPELRSVQPGAEQRAGDHGGEGVRGAGDPREGGTVRPVQYQQNQREGDHFVGKPGQRRCQVVAGHADPPVTRK